LALDALISAFLIQGHSQSFSHRPLAHDLRQRKSAGLPPGASELFSLS